MTTTTGERFTELPRHERLRRLQRVSRIARAMDTAVRIPGTGIRFGADSIVGLIPGVGDAAGGLVGLYMMYEAKRLGIPTHKLARMLANIGVDAAVGSVPLLGDAFDLFFKSHRRNLDIILDHFGEDRAELARDITPRR